MYKVQTQVSFEAAHRLYDVSTYSEECKNNIHGHSYKVTIIVGRDQLNSAGMVVDFKLLKDIVHKLIESPYDHSCILKATDPLSDSIIINCKKVHIIYDNPTAEWMSHTYYNILKDALHNIDTELQLVSVAVQETENNIAIYSED